MRKIVVTASPAAIAPTRIALLPGAYQQPEEFLREHVVVPARAAGCRSLWLGGISLGGYLALLYAARRPGDLDGLCLFAPYLGNRSITGEIQTAVGLSGWNPQHIDDDDEARQIWSFIRRSDAQVPRIHLGIARQDRFGHGHGLFADALAGGGAGGALVG